MRFLLRISLPKVYMGNAVTRYTYLISKKGYVNHGHHDISENLPAIVHVSKYDYVHFHFYKGKEILK